MLIFEINHIFAQKIFKKITMTHILGIGNALVDSLVQVNNDLILKELSLPKGSMQLIDTERYLELQNRMEAYAPKRTTGGSACNTILAIAHMGGQPGLIGKIGHDEPGRFFAKAFRDQGVKTQMLYDKELPTGVASTFITPDGQRTFGTYLGAAANMQPHDFQPRYLRGYDFLYIEGYLVQNHDLIRRAVHLAHRSGMKVCVDMASYNIVQDDRDFFNELLHHTDIVFANELEAEAFTDCQMAEFNVRALGKICEIAVVKVGKKGVLVRHGEEQVFCPAREVPQVVDTTAAGDYFSAGFLHALSEGRSLRTAARLGSLLAGHIIEVVGTALPERTWQKIREEYQEFED